MSWIVNRNIGTRSLNDLPTTTISEIVERAASSSKHTSDACKKGSSECEKPVSENGLTIGLAVGIPIFIIVVVLGFFLLKNYRKEKKEMLEHDPDFDENGEATALPDLPATQKAYEFEDPFHNRNSLRYPVAQYSKSDQPSASSMAPSFHNKEQMPEYVDNIVLPYQHQTGSKQSLDEYARNLSEYQAYGHTPRASTFMNRTRTSSFTNASNLGTYGLNNGSNSNLSATYNNNEDEETSPTKLSFANNNNNNNTTTKGASISPQKSRQFIDISKEQNPPESPTRRTMTNASTSPTKKDTYTSIPNQSTSSFAQAEFFNANDSFQKEGSSDLESVSDSDDENRPITGRNTSVSTDGSYNTTRETTESTFDDTTEDYTEDHSTAHDSHSIPAPNVDTTFESELHSDDANTIQEPNRVSPFETRNILGHGERDDDEDEGFEFSQDSGNADTAHTSINANNDGPSTSHTNEEKSFNGNLSVAGANGTSVKPSKSPRISAFNLLKNDSDDEADEEDRELTVEQEEELKRMKSVYNVYFDRSKSMRVPDGNGSEGQNPENDGQERGATNFSHDPSQPLPDLPSKDYLRINKDLKADADYNKRLTTTSSIYTENPLYVKGETQNYYANGEGYDQHLQPQQQLQPQFEQQYQPYEGHQYEQGGAPHAMAPMQAPPPQHFELPPLQQLPSASDIRKSTIQTYTDFQPRTKNVAQMNKQPFVPIENDGVWTSPITSPVNGSQASFANLNGESTSPQLPQGHATPSATQLARSSVVMLNPVTEITKQRKFKPAGSIGGTPNGSTNSLTNQSIRHQQYENMHRQQAFQNYPNNQQYQQPPSPLSPQGSDLIPDGKNDVRRMMNSNF